MILAPPATRRELLIRRLSADLVVVGGGLGGTCAAITAARAGLKVLQVQDRPILGGNASSEVRLWILGATSHMGNNNRWAREGGVIDEILLENVYRNPEGNPVFVDALLLEKVRAEPNITLLLNTAAIEVDKSADGLVSAVHAFCAQNSTRYVLTAPLFCDASGDGIVGFLAGAAFRMGAESKKEFGEKYAPCVASNELLGHSLYFYSRDTGRSVKYVPPTFALKDITRIPRYRQFNTREHGCQLWWIEFGGRLDTVHDTETIKWELWEVVYGVWNHIKNSGQFPEAENLTLEWVGQIPGKRESRRFEGDYILRQQDIVEQRQHSDAVAFGGWAIDLHPPDGVFSEKPGCAQWHAKGVYQIPYRCLYSRNIDNLFLAGRIISASHVAFGSSRVMATCAHVGQAVGMAAALCRRDGVLPRILNEPTRMARLQQALLRAGQHIPRVPLHDSADLAARAKLQPSSELQFTGFAPDGLRRTLEEAWAILLPVGEGDRLELEILADVASATTLRASLRVSSRVDNYTPDQTLVTHDISVAAGTDQRITVAFDHVFTENRYAFVCFAANPAIALRCSEQRLTGVLALRHQCNGAVSKGATQVPDPDTGFDTFEFWLPERRPGGQNFAFHLRYPLCRFAAENLRSGFARPTDRSNAWVADYTDARPSLTLEWAEPVMLARIELEFDSDFDQPLESVLMGHPERVAPFCVQRFSLIADSTVVIACVEGNHQSRAVVTPEQAVRMRTLRVEFDPPSRRAPVALFGIRCYSGNSLL